MGIRGLTTFIAKNSHKYLERYELHDTYLVIDGNNIACQLYKWHSITNDCFGGDYDKYAKVVFNFFKLLEDCNIIPLVVFDGGYEDKKLKTVLKRLRDKVRVAQRLNSVTQGSVNLFPLFMNDVFVDVVLKLGLKAVRCDFEADYEMACLARNLNCPVLSYDSDFYVFDVLYIPFSSFEMNSYKLKNKTTSGFCIHCSLYKVENFMKLYGGINTSNLPLVATLLGNDYIKESVFDSFYKHIKLPRRNHSLSIQQRKIVSVIKWLQNETYESAIIKILGRLKAKERKHVAEQIELVTEGYLCRNSKYLSYLNIDNVNENIPLNTNLYVNPVDILNNASTECDGCEDYEDDKDSTSDSCKSSSNNSEDDGNLLELDKLDRLEENGPTSDVPDWFIDKFRRIDYPSGFMDILTRKLYFCTPQLENYSNICSHSISAQILSGINKILLSGSSETLEYVARSENGGVRRYTTPICNVNLPKLHEIQNVSPKDAKSILLEILKIKEEDVTFLDKLPCQWQLYILSIIYWIKNAILSVSYCHVYSIVLGMLVLNIVDTKIGFYRSNTKFLNKFEKRLNVAVSENKYFENESVITNFTMFLNNITYNDCLLCMKQVIKYFRMEEKMKTHLKLYDIHILDCFAQFQSCLMHIKYLNKLLNNPYNHFSISQFYNGTFLYNACVDFMKRTDIDAYVAALLKDSPTFLKCFRTLANMLIKTLSGELRCNVGKRRRNKKKNNTKAEDLHNVASKEIESEEDNLMDVNNRFSLLNLVN